MYKTQLYILIFCSFSPANVTLLFYQFHICLRNSCSTQSLFCKSTFDTIYILLHTVQVLQVHVVHDQSLLYSPPFYKSTFPKFMVYTVHVLPTPLLPPQPTSYRFVSQTYVLHFNVYNSAFYAVVLF